MTNCTRVVLAAVVCGFVLGGAMPLNRTVSGEQPEPGPRETTIDRALLQEHMNQMRNLQRSFEARAERLLSLDAPVGMIAAFSGAEAPSTIGDMWLPCDGREVDQKQYPELFVVIGSSYGKAAKDKFRLPELKDEFLRGWGDDRKVGSSQKDAVDEDIGKRFGKIEYLLKNHRHRMAIQAESSRDLTEDGTVVTSGRSGADSKYGLDEADGEPNRGRTGRGLLESLPQEHRVEDTAVRYSNETRPHNVAVMFLIKTKSARSLIDVSTEASPRSK